MLEKSLRSLLREIPDFPRPGIIFKDITPLLGDVKVRKEVVQQISRHFINSDIDIIAAVEARGFIFGSLIAQELNIPLVPIRKEGKLPYHKVKEEYVLEYGSASIEMHIDSITSNARVLIHDDLLATGGTAMASGNLVQKLGGIVAGYSFIINLSFLQGEMMLKDKFKIQPHYLIKYE